MNYVQLYFPQICSDILDLEKNGFRQNDSIWIFSSSKPITEINQQLILKKLNIFCSQWHSHQLKVLANTLILLDHFIVVIVQESTGLISGCSKDSLFKQIISLEKEFTLSLLNPLNLFFYNLLLKNIEVYSLNEIKQNGLSKEKLNDLLFFDNTIKSISNLSSNWIIPFPASQVYKNLFI